MKLNGKTVLITGASSGIGKDFALKAAEDKAHIILSSRNKDKLESVKSEIESLGGTAEVIVCDVRDASSIRDLFLKATENGRVIDVVLNNAGLGHIGNIYELTPEQIKEVIDVNIYGMITVSKYASEVFVRQKYGHLIMTSSLAGLITLPQWSVYVASKWAITGFAGCIRAELKPHNVLVTTVHPGAVKTEFFDPDKANIDISKMGEAIEVREVSNVIYDAVFTNKKRVLIPQMTKNFALMYKYLPNLVEAQLEKLASKIEYHTNTEEDEPEFDYIAPVKE